MEIVRAESRDAPRNELQERYPMDLSMYVEVPTEQIAIEEFQEFAVERVKLLRAFEIANVKTSKDLSFKEQVVNEAAAQNVKYFMPLLKGYVDYEARRIDHLSHFILRLFYCRSEEYRKWFIARELDFFRLKFANSDRREDVTAFMKRHGLNYAPITDEEKKTLATDIISSTVKNISLETACVYKVPFSQVLDLVRGRKVFVKGGFAYVPQSDLNSLLVSIYRASLSHSLSMCAANIPLLENDERLARIMRGLHTSSTTADYSVGAKENVPIAALDALSSKSFPMCMRLMHETFRKSNHLRHQARLQYGLFLKGIGVTLEDSLRFWKEGFTKKEDIDAEMFDKCYAYNIRHSYGKEGKRTNYTPHSCMKIIMTSVAPGDNHGCPFKHSDANILKQRLFGYRLAANEVADIVNYASGGHYQLACTRYFEAVHAVSNAKGINHPNQYFEESQKLINKPDDAMTMNDTLDELII